MRQIITIAAALITVNLSAESWDLQRCIQYALDNNLTVKQYELNKEAGDISLNTASMSRLPGLNASAGESLSFGRGLTADNTYANTNTTSTSLSLSAGVNLFSGFNTRYTIEQSRLNLEAATADLEKARDDIRLAVAAAYIQILYNREVSNVARKQIEIDSLQVENLRVRRDQGLASAAEVAQQEATLAQSRLTETQAQNNYNLAILELTQLLELPSPEGFTIVTPNLDTVIFEFLPTPETIYADAVVTKPSITAEKLRLDAAETGIRIAKSALYPSLSLSAGLGSNYYTSSNGYTADTFMNQLRHNFSQYVGLNLSVPIFNRFATRNSIRNARLSRDRQLLQLETARKALYKEIQQAYYNASAAQSRYQSSSAASKSNEAAFALMSAKYDNGKASITEFNESKNRYLSSLSTLLQAEYEYLYQTRILRFYQGESLTF